MHSAAAASVRAVMASVSKGRLSMKRFASLIGSLFTSIKPNAGRAAGVPIAVATLAFEVAQERATRG